MSSETDSLLFPNSKNDNVETADESTHAYQAVKGSGTSQSSRQEVMADVRDALKDHLDEALEGDDFFLTMSLARNLSLLPSKPELNQAVEELQGELSALTRNITNSFRKKPHDKKEEDEKEEEEIDHEKSPPLKAYLTLGSAVCALSSIGPCLAKQVDVDATLKIVWRFQGTGRYIECLLTFLQGGWISACLMEKVLYSIAKFCSHTSLCIFPSYLHSSGVVVTLGNSFHYCGWNSEIDYRSVGNFSNGGSILFRVVRCICNVH